VIRVHREGKRKELVIPLSHAAESAQAPTSMLYVDVSVMLRGGISCLRPRA